MYCGKLIQLGFVVQVSYAWDITLGKKMRERERERESRPNKRKRKQLQVYSTVAPSKQSSVPWFMRET